MSIRSFIVTSNKDKEKKFPKLMISNSDDSIILVESRNYDGTFSGTLIYSAIEESDIGFYSSKWDEKSFGEFNGTIQLLNE